MKSNWGFKRVGRYWKYAVLGMTSGIATVFFWGCSPANVESVPEEETVQGAAPVDQSAVSSVSQSESDATPADAQVDSNREQGPSQKELEEIFLSTIQPKIYRVAAGTAPASIGPETSGQVELTWSRAEEDFTADQVVWWEPGSSLSWLLEIPGAASMKALVRFRPDQDRELEGSHPVVSASNQSGAGQIFDLTPWLSSFVQQRSGVLAVVAFAEIGSKNLSFRLNLKVLGPLPSFPRQTLRGARAISRTKASADELIRNLASGRRGHELLAEVIANPLPIPVFVRIRGQAGGVRVYERYRNTYHSARDFVGIQKGEKYDVFRSHGEFSDIHVEAYTKDGNRVGQWKTDIFKIHSLVFEIPAQGNLTIAWWFSPRPGPNYCRESHIIGEKTLTWKDHRFCPDRCPQGAYEYFSKVVRDSAELVDTSFFGEIKREFFFYHSALPGAVRQQLDYSGHGSGRAEYSDKVGLWTLGENQMEGAPHACRKWF